MDPICGCILSPVFNAACLDPACSNSIAYLPQDRREEKLAQPCPEVCLQQILINETGGNVTVSNAAFALQCNKYITDESKKNYQFSKWYECKDGQCRLRPIGVTGLTGAYENDPSCGGTCERVEPDSYYKCAGRQCIETTQSDGTFVNDNKCGFTCEGQSSQQKLYIILGFRGGR